MNCCVLDHDAVEFGCKGSRGSKCFISEQKVNMNPFLVKEDNSVVKS